jgi:hypothetical protein
MPAESLGQAWRNNRYPGDVRHAQQIDTMKQMHAEMPEPSFGKPRFLIGRDSRGYWVAQDERGLRGGLFANRTEALHFAMLQNGNRPQAVIMVPGVLELQVSATTGAQEQDAAAARRRG